MENGGMEWGEIYGTNPSRVLKTLASAAATSPSFSPSFSPLPCSPLFLPRLSNHSAETRSRASQSAASPKAESSHIKPEVFSCLLETENMDTTDTLWPSPATGRLY
ncbi:unnamed protein product [Pleuronectes platessa]|uniref:Uncharacterized protein n=1 Tax=Pleuronectes platessa TaxID=8262 RepID=A0A9N7UQA1_PLEPL|nr:unnamed protein product [Pleuronectes platessa]